MSSKELYELANSGGGVDNTPSASWCFRNSQRDCGASPPCGGDGSRAVFTDKNQRGELILHTLRNGDLIFEEEESLHASICSWISAPSMIIP